MEKFNGFPPGKIKTTRIPNQFFSELMPEIDDLDELKLTLYVFWALQQQEGEYRYLSGSEILQDELFLKAMGGSSDSPEEKVQKALECAVSRGTLLHVFIPVIATHRSCLSRSVPTSLRSMSKISGR